MGVSKGKWELVQFRPLPCNGEPATGRSARRRGELRQKPSSTATNVLTALKVLDPNVRVIPENGYSNLSSVGPSEVRGEGVPAETVQSGTGVEEDPKGD